MCFIISHKHPIVKIADKDIKCYKLVLASKYADKHWFIAQDAVIPTYYSEFREFRYVEGMEYDLGTSLEVIAYVDHLTNKVVNMTPIIEAGFHSYKNIGVFNGPSRFDSNDNLLSVVEFSIPKGSEYYYNEEFEEYVSNRIKCKRGIAPLHYLWLSIISVF